LNSSDSLIGSAQQLIRHLQQEGEFNYAGNTPTPGNIALREQARQWVDSFQRQISDIPPANLITALELYNILYRVANRRPPDRRKIARHYITLLNLYLAGDKSIPSNDLRAAISREVNIYHNPDFDGIPANWLKTSKP